MVTTRFNSSHSSQQGTDSHIQFIGAVIDSISSCPYVTTVGGTRAINPEIAAYLSGGGFSRYFGIPDYQSTAVDLFINGLGTQFDGLYK